MFFFCRTCSWSTATIHRVYWAEISKSPLVTSLYCFVAALFLYPSHSSVFSCSSADRKLDFVLLCLMIYS